VIAMVWMRHSGHGGVAQFPEGSVEAWQALGWEPCEDPPPDPDPALIEHESPAGPSLADPTADEPDESEPASEPELPADHPETKE
jgi:hypothetical protein